MEEDQSHSNSHEDDSANNSEIIMTPTKKGPPLKLEIDAKPSNSIRRVKKLVREPSQDEQQKSPASSTTETSGRQNTIKKVSRSNKMAEVQRDTDSNNSLELPVMDTGFMPPPGPPKSPLKNLKMQDQIPQIEVDSLEFNLENSTEQLKHQSLAHDLSISNMSDIDFKPEGQINDTLEFDNFNAKPPVILDFPDPSKRAQRPSKTSLAPSTNVRSTPLDANNNPRATNGRRQVKQVNQGDKATLMHNQNIRQEPKIVESKIPEDTLHHKIDETKIDVADDDKSNSSKSSSSGDSQHPSFHAKKYESPAKKPKQPEILKSNKYSHHNLIKGDVTDSQKIKSTRSHDGVPYVDLVKEQKTRAIRIENERADMGFWELYYNRFQKNALFAIENAKKSLSLWESTIRKLEGKFGTGVGSFFRLLRWLVIMNTITAIMYSIIYIPAWQKRQVSGASFYASFPIMIAYGESTYFAAPILLVLMIIYLIFSVTQMIRRLKDEYLKDSRISTDEVFPFSTAAFTSWNFGTRGKEASLNQYFAIANVFRTLITAEEIEEKKKEYKNKFFIARRVSGLLISGALLTISGYLINLSSGGNASWNYFARTVRIILTGTGNDSSRDTPFLIAMLNLVLPTMFEIIAKIMTFADPVTEQAFAIFLSFFAKMGGLFVVLFTVKTQNKGNFCRSQFDDYTASYGYTLINPDVPRTAFTTLSSTDINTIVPFVVGNSYCWEYNLGITMVILLGLELAITTVTTIGIALFKKFVFKRYQFEMNKNILELAYRQSIVWIGTALAPGVIYLSIFGYFVVFWVKTIVLRSLGSPPRRIYNAHKQTMYFLISLMAAFLVVIGPFIVGFVVAPPGSCGPAFALDAQDVNTCSTLYGGNPVSTTAKYCVYEYINPSKLYSKHEVFEVLPNPSGSGTLICDNPANMKSTALSGNAMDITKFKPSNWQKFPEITALGQTFKDAAGNAVPDVYRGPYNLMPVVAPDSANSPISSYYESMMKSSATDYWQAARKVFGDVFNTESTGSYQLLPKYFSTLNSTSTQPLQFAQFVVNPVVLLVTISCMGIWVYYLKALAIKKNRRVGDLLMELNSEREEKRYLLKKLRRHKIERD